MLRAPSSQSPAPHNTGNTPGGQLEERNTVGSGILQHAHGTACVIEPAEVATQRDEGSGKVGVALSCGGLCICGVGLQEVGFW